MKQILAFLLFMCGMQIQAQQETFPIYLGCEVSGEEESKLCFYNSVQRDFFNSFKMPNQIPSDYKGTAIILFEVSQEGEFKTIYVDNNQSEIISESKRVIASLPKAKAATFNGRSVYSKYTIRVDFPLTTPSDLKLEDLGKPKVNPVAQASIDKEKIRAERNKELQEFDSVAKLYIPWNNPQFKSKLNIPFSHSYYAQFDGALNKVGSNNHTASKPYSYSDVNRYYDLEKAYLAIKKNKSSWFGKKLWNESTVQIQGEDYWFTLNPILDLQLGYSHNDNVDYTYVNTRGLRLEGGFLNKLHFSTTIYESQGRFADYFNGYAESIRPSGGNPAVIPGIGIAKSFKTDSYDFPLAEANLSYAPSKFIDLNLGYGRNFIGDGYRSLLLGDGASPYPYFKMNTTFWKIKYTNVYTWMKDIRPDATIDGTYGTKFSAAHYLSMNLTKHWNIGLFESVVWAKDNNRGFDMSFVNPIIFYRSVEFASSSRSGNALLALTSKYKFSNNVNIYGQYLLDEFSMNDMKSGDQSWKNKFAYQLGVKYYNAFNVDNLLVQAEYNHVRPYVYSHSNPKTNYAHNNQSIGHNWGGNFRELLLIGRYTHGRYFADAKFTFGEKGFDFNTTENSYNYGGDIFANYNENRPFNVGVKPGQGNTTKIFFSDIQAGYLVNPATNLKLYVSYIYRSFQPKQDVASVFGENTSWFSIGLRSDVFNWYFDY